MEEKEADKVNLRSLSTNHIDIEIQTNVDNVWRLTGFYGEPVRANRKKTWDLLRNLARDSNLPWCVIGDINNITSQEDKKGGAVYPRWLVEGFNNTLLETELHDLELVGHQYTWEKGRNTEAWIEIRLDRALINNMWLTSFPLTKLYNLYGGPSNHSPLLLEPKKKVIGGQKRSQNLEIWGKEITGCFIKRIKESKLELKALRGRRDVNLVELYKKAKQRLHLLLDHKEIFWRQRSKQLWLQSGDKNTKYFHASCNSRRRTNQIHKLRNEEGDWVDWQSGLDDLITTYYQTLFKASHTVLDEVVNCMPTTITEEQNMDLIMPIAEKGVKAALFQMHPDKAPGPDGMTPTFFQKHWYVMGNHIIELTRYFFETGDILEGLNKMNIVLVPKKKDPFTITELCPIALCNVLMKVITKVLANRLKEVLNMVVSDTQSAFMPGRLISDNIMISYEILTNRKYQFLLKSGLTGSQDLRISGLRLSEDGYQNLGTGGLTFKEGS
ncbi:hypothetical protein AgCh_036452 [Apium graveolens]